jgi:hypothetical protein
VRRKLQAENVTKTAAYLSPKFGFTIEHADDLVMDLPVYTEDGWTARLLVESDWTAIWRSSKFADKPVAISRPIGNEVFVDCISELDRQTKERCLLVHADRGSRT